MYVFFQAPVKVRRLPLVSSRVACHDRQMLPRCSCGSGPATTPSSSPWSGARSGRAAQLPGCAGPRRRLSLAKEHGWVEHWRIYHRRKFRSQTSDNMDRWKSRGGKSQRGEEKEREDKGRERVRRKKMQVHEKVGKSRFAVLFKWFGAPEGRKVTSLKRRMRSQLARWEMKNCTPLWREAHFQVKMYNVQSTPFSDHFWKLRCRKSARRCGAKHISNSKV